MVEAKQFARLATRLQSGFALLLCCRNQFWQFCSWVLYRPKMASRKPGFIRISLGDEAVMQADYFCIIAEEAAKGHVVLALVEHGGGKVLAKVPDFAISHLQEATRAASSIYRKDTVRDKIRSKWGRLRIALQTMRGEPEERLRLKSGEVRMVRADLIAGSAWKDSSIGRTSVMITEDGGGTAIILLPDKSLSDFATAAFHAIRTARTAPRNTSGGPIPETVTRAVIPDAIGVMEPKSIAAPPDHAVLRITIGGVPLLFSAHREMWRQIFDVLCKE